VVWGVQKYHKILQVSLGLLDGLGEKGQMRQLGLFESLTNQKRKEKPLKTIKAVN
jgi:hypothetical protein